MKRSKTRIGIIVLAILLIIAFFVFWMSGPTSYAKQISWTQLSLEIARSSVQKFKEIEGRWPSSLGELKQYAAENPQARVGQSTCTEYISDVEGNPRESAFLDGRGGLYYDKASGQVRINLTKPVKHYLTFYFGPKRNEIPSDW